LALSSIIRSPLRSIVRSSLAGEPQNLLDAATEYLGGIEPLHYWDFTTNRALFAGVARSSLSDTPGWSFTRATVGTAETAAGAIVEFASGQLRRTDKGVLIESARTNLFLNSSVGVTQSVTVAAAAHTLSMRGTGTITLTGTSTAGPLVGTGVNNTVSLTFTPTAGTLTLTVSGSVTNVNLEAGAFATSWIPTAGASVTRDADVLQVTGMTLAYPLSLFAQYDRIIDTAANETLMQVDLASSGNPESSLLRVDTTDKAVSLMTDGGTTQGSALSVASVSAGSVVKIAGRFNVNSVNVALNGAAATEDAIGTLPDAPDRLTIGARGNSSVFAHNYIRRLAIFNTALSDANLQAVTA
jgi:hypothetical protein